MFQYPPRQWDVYFLVWWWYLEKLGVHIPVTGRQVLLNLSVFSSLPYFRRTGKRIRSGTGENRKMNEMTGKIWNVNAFIKSRLSPGFLVFDPQIQAALSHFIASHQ
jgi:hypothetical protein